MRYIDLGLSDYKEAYKTQCEVRSKVAEGACENTLIITEHKSVITIGRIGSKKHIFKTEGIEVLNVDRGGDVTYHGPGQLVAYPIFKLENFPTKSLTASCWSSIGQEPGSQLR